MWRGGGRGSKLNFFVIVCYFVYFFSIVKEKKFDEILRIPSRIIFQTLFFIVPSMDPGREEPI